jgi:hypothetical protein
MVQWDQRTLALAIHANTALICLSDQELPDVVNDQRKPFHIWIQNTRKFGRRLREVGEGRRFELEPFALELLLKESNNIAVGNVVPKGVEGRDSRL